MRDSISAAVLGGVERTVGNLNQVVRGLRVRWLVGNPDRSRCPPGAPDVCLLDVPADTFPNLYGPGKIGLRKDDGKFFTAISHRHI